MRLAHRAPITFFPPIVAILSKVAILVPVEQKQSTACSPTPNCQMHWFRPAPYSGRARSVLPGQVHVRCAARAHPRLAGACASLHCVGHACIRDLLLLGFTWPMAKHLETVHSCILRARQVRRSVLGGICGVVVDRLSPRDFQCSRMYITWYFVSHPVWAPSIILPTSAFMPFLICSGTAACCSS